MGSLDLNYEGKIPKVGTKNYEKWTDNVALYYIPDAEKWIGTRDYAPVDKNDVVCGILLYSNDSESEHNQMIAHNQMGKGYRQAVELPALTKATSSC
jgi:hypothetical protein